MKWENMVISGLIIVSLLVVVFSFAGLVDFNPVTTRALLENRLSYAKQEITLRDVFVTDIKYKKLNEDEVFLILYATNTHQGFSPPKKPKDIVKIVARAPLKLILSSGLIESRMFGQDIDRRVWFPYFKIKVMKKYNVLTELPESLMDNGSWLTTPYDLSMKIANIFVSLQVAVIIALIVQLLVSLVVVRLVLMGVIIALPVP